MVILEMLEPSAAAQRLAEHVRVFCHWSVAFLVVVQWMTYDAIQRTHGTLLPPRSADLLEHGVHTWSGIAIGVLMTVMLIARLVRKKKEAAADIA